MKNEGIIRVMKNIESEFYSAVGVDIRLEFDTGGIYYGNPNNFNKEYISADDSRIKHLRINGVIIKN
jgi:hypothetical protein